VTLVDHGLPVDVSREYRARFENLAGFPGFRRSDGARLLRRFALDPALAAIQVKQDDLVAEIGVTGDGSSAAVLGVSGVAACNHHTQFARGNRWFGGQQDGTGQRRYQCGLFEDSAPRESWHSKSGVTSSYLSRPGRRYGWYPSEEALQTFE
jgi:hypothetical protein